MAAERTSSTTNSDKTLLVGIGAQRSGTSWLGAYLAAHPDVYMSPVKELHYFDARLMPETCGAFEGNMRKRFDALSNEPASDKAEVEALGARLAMTSDRDYIEYFLNRAGDAMVMSEITPSYAMLDRVGFARIAAVHSAVKFVFLLRNPVERAWSQMRRRELKASLSLSDAEIEAGISHPEIVARTDYRRTMNEVFAAVPTTFVFAEFFERLFDDRAIARFCQFAGIAFRAGDYGGRVNAATDRPMPLTFRQKAYARFADVYRYIHDLFAGNIPQSWLDDMAAFA